MYLCSSNGTLSLKINDQLTTSNRNGRIAVKAGRSGDIGVRVGTAKEGLAKVGDALHEVNELHNSFPFFGSEDQVNDWRIYISTYTNTKIQNSSPQWDQ